MNPKQKALKEIQKGLKTSFSDSKLPYGVSKQFLNSFKSGSQTRASLRDKPSSKWTLASGNILK